MARAPRRWRLPVFLALTAAGFVLGELLTHLEARSDAYADRLGAFANRFPHPEYAAWLIAAAGIAGAAHETVAALRDRRSP